MNLHPTRESIESCALGALESDEERRVLEHLATCAECRSEHEAARRAMGLFRQAVGARDAASPELARLRDRLSRESAPARRTSLRLFSPRTATRVAASLVVGLGVTMLLARMAVHRFRDPCQCRPWAVSGVLARSGESEIYPLVRDQRVYALHSISGQPRLVSLDRRTGATMWTTPCAVKGLPAADSNRVFAWSQADSGGLHLAAFDGRTGRELWRHGAPGQGAYRAPPEIVVGSAGVGWVDPTGVTWLDAASGRARWSAELPPDECARAKLVVGCDAAIVAVTARRVQALSTADGHTLWMRESESVPGGWIHCRVSSDGERIAVTRRLTARVDRVECINLRSGEALWSSRTPTASHVVFNDGILYVRSQEIIALDAKSGARRWAVKAEGCSPITITGKRLYVVAGANGVLAVHAETGARLWRSQPLPSCSGVAVAGKMGYLSTRDGMLRSIRLAEEG